MSVLRPDLMMKSVVPVIMAGIIAVRTCPTSPAVILHIVSSYLFDSLGTFSDALYIQIYGLVVSVLIAGDCA